MIKIVYQPTCCWCLMNHYQPWLDNPIMVIGILYVTIVYHVPCLIVVAMGNNWLTTIVLHVFGLLFQGIHQWKVKRRNHKTGEVLSWSFIIYYLKGLSVVLLKLTILYDFLFLFSWITLWFCISLSFLLGLDMAGCIEWTLLHSLFHVKRIHQHPPLFCSFFFFPAMYAQK